MIDRHDFSYFSVYSDQRADQVLDVRVYTNKIYFYLDNFEVKSFSALFSRVAEETHSVCTIDEDNYEVIFTYVGI